MQVARKQTSQPNASAYERLQSSGAGPSEWYMYYYLKGLAQARDTRVVRTCLTHLRYGVEDAKPLKLALNTMRATIDSLEAQGLISVQRVPDSRTVYLDITIL